MDTNEYRRFTETTWVQPVNDKITREEALNLFVMVTGWAGETGEAIEHIKKYVRDGNVNRELFLKELGDTFYYYTRLLDFFGFTLDEVMEKNVEKLVDRVERGVVRGSGDTR